MIHTLFEEARLTAFDAATAAYSGHREPPTVVLGRHGCSELGLQSIEG